MNDVTSNIVQTNLSVPINIKHDKYIPIGNYNNNRYRGPIESSKELSVDEFIIKNIGDLFKIYDNLSTRYKKDIETISVITVENELTNLKTLEEL